MLDFLQTSFLAGLGALAVPVVIHLFFRLKTKRVDLGTIRFLRVVLEENARRRKVMRWFLLALRMAFVALLVGLFARPYLKAATPAGDKQLLVILIDQSATMQLKGENGRLVDQAVAEAKKLIASSGRETRFEVALFDQSVHPLTDVANQDGSTSDATLTKLQAPAVTFGTTNFGAALAWARDICVKTAAGKKQLHLYTDLQRSGLDWSEVEPWPAEVPAWLHDLGRPVVNNVAVTEVRTPRWWVRPDEAPQLRVSVMHGGTIPLEEVAVALEIGRLPPLPATTPGVADDSRAGRRTEFAKLAERVTKRERIKLEPGAAVTLDFELPPLSAGLWQGRVTIEYDDDLAFDNQRYFAISAAPPYPILVVRDQDTEASMSSETFFFQAALRLAREGESSVESPFVPTGVAYANRATWPPLNDFDAIVLANVGEVSIQDARQLETFVRSGRGLLVFSGNNISAKSCAALSEAGLTPGKISDPKNAVDLPWRLAHWDEKHPVLEPLSDPQHGDLRRLTFAAYTPIVPDAGVKVLARFNTGEPAVLERAVGHGTVLWVSTSCGREWSDWYRSRMYLPLVHQLLGYQVGLTAGGRVRTRMIGGDRQEETVLDELSPTTDHAAADQTIPGVDQFSRHAWVTNVNPRESEPDRCTRQEFEDRFAMKFADDETPSATHALAQEQVEFQRDELWHWVGCVLLGVILLEGFVGNRTTA